MGISADTDLCCDIDGLWCIVPCVCDDGGCVRARWSAKFSHVSFLSIFPSFIPPVHWPPQLPSKWKLHPPLYHLGYLHEIAASFCVVLQDFQLMTPQIVCACPPFNFRPPSLILLPHIEKGEMGREQGEQQENSDWVSAVWTVVARAERMACCVWQQQYCVSGLSVPLSCPSLLYGVSSFYSSSKEPVHLIRKLIK